MPATTITMHPSTMAPVLVWFGGVRVPGVPGCQCIPTHKPADDQSYHRGASLASKHQLDPAYAQAARTAAELARNKAGELRTDRPKCFVAGSLWGVHVSPAALQSKVALADAIGRACPTTDVTSALHVVLVSYGGEVRECPANCKTCSTPGARWACCNAQDVARLYVAGMGI